MRIGITGHRGLPEKVAAAVRELLEAELTTRHPAEIVAISCLADGPDAWWAQAVVDAGGRLEAVIPAATYRDGLPDWHHAAYDRLLAAAVEVHHTGLEKSDSAAHMAGSEILVGLSDHLLAVWDGQPAHGFGGSADVVAYARRTGVPVSVVWPAGARR